MTLCSLPIRGILAGVLVSVAIVASLICHVQGRAVYFSKVVTPDTGVLVNNIDIDGSSSTSSSSTSNHGISITADDDCTTNFATLEKALLETKNNKYKLIQAFYPNDKYDTIYVTDVEYHFLGKDDNDTETISSSWIWALSAFYLIQPPSVFQYTSLLFSSSVDEVDNSPLLLYLPYQCRLTDLNLTAVNNTCHQSINPMLKTLTQRLKYYAKTNGIGHVLVKDDSNTAAVCDSELDNENYNSKQRLTSFFSLIFGLPLLLICLLVMVVKSLQNPIRRSIRKTSNHPNIAALALTGLYISIFICAMDATAVHLVSRNKHELSNYKGKFKQYYYPLRYVFVLLVIDLVSLLTIIYVYFICFLICFQKDQKTGKNLNTCIGCTFVCMYCPVFGLIKMKDKGDIAPSDQPTGEQATTTVGNLKLNDMFSEYKIWLVLCSFIAPFICLLSHAGFITAAWVSNPEHAWSSAIRTLFSFLFFFFMFRQSYVRFNKPWTLDYYCFLKYCICGLCCWCSACCCNENLCYQVNDDILEELEPLNIDEENTKDDKVEVESINFDFRAFFISGILGLFIAGIQGLVIFSFIELPLSTDTAPSYILNIVQLSFLVIAVFVAYKVIVLHKPIEKSILEKVTGIFKHLKQPNGGPQQQPNSNTDGT